MDIINPDHLAEAVKPLEDKALTSLQSDIQSLMDWANKVLDTYKIVVTLEKK